MSKPVAIFVVYCLCVCGIAWLASSAEARRCATPCELEQRLDALEQQLASGYWYPYPPDRNEAEMN